MDRLNDRLIAGMTDADADAPFHPGEMALQQAAGMRDRMAQIGPRVIRDQMPDEHRELFEELPMLVVGSLDTQERPWASVLAGWPGFVQTPDAHTMRVDALPRQNDPLRERLAPGARLGVLGIQPQTRRRNRMNGTVTSVDADGFALHVDQSFGNCPQYIQARRPTWVERDAADHISHAEGPHLSVAARDWIARADTLFIASAAAPAIRTTRRGGVDVSHRGGLPGFVAVEQDDRGTVLTLPDYRGNFFFNTLGNIAAWPHAGLLFVDYASGDTLQLTGSASIDANPQAARAFPGAQRLLRLRVEAGLWTRAALPYTWSESILAPQFAA